MKNNPQTRRAFIGNCALAMAGAAFASTDVSVHPDRSSVSSETATGDTPNQICAFSKMFDFMGNDMFAFLSDAGFQGIDLTVRPDGFVTYEKVGKGIADAVNNAQKKGLTIPMIATGITSSSNPVTEKILKAASDAGIKHYRMGYYSYKDNLSIEQNLETFRRDMQELAEMNVRYGIQGNYQNHVGGMFGGAIWDLWTVIREMDSKYTACQYDVRHAVADGLSSWKSALKAISPHIGTLCVKDFIFEERNGRWGVRSVPLGTGAVDLKAYRGILREKNVLSPMSIHFEFPLLDDVDTSLTDSEKMKKMLPLVKKEADTLRNLMNS